MNADLYAIGVIIGARGLSGEVKVKPLTDHLDRFDNLDTICLQKSNYSATYSVEKIRIFKGLILMVFSGIQTRTAAEELVGSELLVTSNELVELDNNEYFWFDLLGMEVYTTSGEKIGILTNIIEGAANDVYAVNNDKGEILIPAVQQVVKQVDIKQKKMIINPIKGLISDDQI